MQNDRQRVLKNSIIVTQNVYHNTQKIIQCNTWRLFKNRQPSVFFIEPFKKKYLQSVRRALQQQNHIDYDGEMYEPLRKTELERRSIVPDLASGTYTSDNDIRRSF